MQPILAPILGVFYQLVKRKFIFILCIFLLTDRARRGIRGYQDAMEQNKMANVIFDLDGTVIDSSHRHATNSDGSIDLAHWFENCKREKVMADSLLPLAKVMRSYFEQGHRVIICTARCFQAADYEFLIRNNIPSDHLLTRSGYFVTPDSYEFSSSYHGFIGDSRGDGEMKVAMLTELALSLGYKNLADMNAIMFDDNLNVIKAMLEARVMCHNAIEINDLLGRSDLPFDINELREAA